MPHFVLECSANIVESLNHRDLFSRLHSLLAESGPFKLDEIKSRIVRHDEYLVGNGDPSTAFVHLTLSILEGRDFTLQRTVGERIMDFLRKEFSQSAAERTLSLSLEVREMRRQTYFKS